MKTQHHVVRDTSGTGDTNYGWMSLYELDGLHFVTSPDQADFLGAKVVPCAAIPEFVPSITLRIIKNVHYSELWIYPVSRQDIRKLGETLSAKHTVTASACARILATWEEGTLVKGPFKLSDFYSNITPEEDALYSF